MVIQRIQTVWLFIATLLMVFVGLRPIAWIDTVAVTVNDYPTLSILNWLTVAMTFLAIFMFKNLRLQKTMSLISLLLMISEIVLTYVILGRTIDQCELEWIGGPVAIGLAAIFDLLAYRGMASDHKKLRNADRFWA